jgi:hypothetical protein
VWPYDVATPAGVIEIVLHIELDSELARRIRLGKALVAQQAGWTRGTASDARVRVELFVTRLFVALKTMIACLARCPITQETWIMKAELHTRILALVSDVVTGRANQLPIFQRRPKIFTNALSVDSNIGRVPARNRSTAIAMTSVAQRLGVAFVQADIACDGRCIDVAYLASALIPVRIVLGTDSSRQQQPDN